MSDLGALPSLLLWLLGLFLMARIPSFARNRSPSRPAAAQDEPAPRISIIIPARNEARRIGALLASLSRQTWPPHEILVVNDGSTDQTATVAGQLGATVIASQPLPPRWNGKPWACWQGAQRATGDLLLFLDADTWLEPDGIRRLVLAQQARGGLLTVQPYHVTHKPYEQLSAFFNIVLMAAMNAFTPLGNALRPGGAFGPCVMCNQPDYFHVGGHSQVKDQVLESIGLAQAFLQHHLPVSCYAGRGAISFRMYPGGLGELVEGWSKGFGSGALAVRIPFLLLTVAWVWGCFDATFGLLRAIPASFTPDLWARLLAYGLYAVQIHWMLARIGRFCWWTALLFPLPLLYFGIIMLRSLILIHVLRRVAWRGRTISTRSEKEEP